MLILGQSALDITAQNESGSKQAVSQHHYVWLRDNCTCPECIHPDTKERVLVTAEIAADIAPISASIVDAELLIEWNQGQHLSRYPLQWLHQHSYSNTQVDDDTALGELKLWGHELQGSIPSFNYQELYDDPKVLLKWCEAVRDYGLTIVRDAPLKEAEIERFADFVAVVRETIYDRLHNVRATPGEYNAYNVASTTLELKPHTDMPCYNNPPGVQMFHFLVNETQGGESTAVDGFKVVAQLKETNPEAYRILTTTPVSFRMFSDRGDVQSQNPLLTLDTNGQMKVFRFSNQTAQTMSLPPAQMTGFYDAYRALGKLIESPDNKVQFRLATGDMMVTNNLRVMHGRNSYVAGTGERHLQLSYMDMDDVLSRIRMLKKGQVKSATRSAA
jgi:gamma-butyrobetaine dioxygenase